MEEFFSSWSFGAFAGGASIVGLVWFLVDKIKKRKSKLFLSNRRVELLKKSGSGSRDVTVSMNGVTSDRLIREFFFILNRSEVTITTDDFIKAPEIPIKPEAKIFEASILGGNGLQDASLWLETSQFLFVNFIFLQARVCS